MIKAFDRSLVPQSSAKEARLQEARRAVGSLTALVLVKVQGFRVLGLTALGFSRVRIWGLGFTALGV